MKLGLPEGGVIKAAENSSRVRNLQRKAEPSRFVDVPKISRQDVEVVKTTPAGADFSRQDLEVVTTTRRSGFLNGARLSKCPRPGAGEVPRSPKLSLRSEVLDGGERGYQD